MSSLTFGRVDVAASELKSKNELLVLAACNSAAFLDKVQLAKGSAVIGFTSDRTDSAGNQGYIQSGFLGNLAVEAIRLIKSGASPQEVKKGLQDYADKHEKKWDVDVTVKIRENR